jgi:hypothetical protein
MFQRHIKVFIASKMRHAEKFRDIREEYPDIYFTARWPVTASLSSEAQRPVYQWMGDAFSDIHNSDVVIVYAEKGEHLKTALVHVGFAIAAGKPIWVIGEHASYAEWQFYEGVCYRAPTIDRALADIKVLYRGKPQRNWRGDFSVHEGDRK